MLYAIRGRRTYIIAVCMVIYAVLGFFLGKQTQDEMVMMVLNALAVAGLRAGIANKNNE